MSHSFEIGFPQGTRASAVHVDPEDDADSVVAELGLGPVSAALVVAGGADGLAAADGLRLQPLFALIASLAGRFDAAVVDGGTDTGAMRLMGEARAGSPDFPLLGVVVAQLATDLEPYHSHFALVPGSRWGDEVPWVVRLAGALGGGRAATIVVNGGEISRSEAAASVEIGRPVVAIEGTGRAADDLAAVARSRAVTSGLLYAVHADDSDGLVSVLGGLLNEEP